MAQPTSPRPEDDDVARRILVLRGDKVLLDADLAQLYGVTTKRLNEQIKRNRAKFPPDFVFTLKKHELADLRSQFATSSLARWGGRRYRPFAFTEHGALMAANVLNSRRAVDVAINVVEKKTAQLASKHDALATDTRSQLEQVISALRQLMSRPEPARRPIGFVTPR